MTVSDLQPCWLEVTHGPHKWLPMVEDPENDHVIHIGLATLICPGNRGDE